MSSSLERMYQNVRQLPNGQLVGTQPQLFTTGLFVGLDAVGDYAYRYCYEREADAAFAARTWNGVGDPPGPWLKLKGKPGGDRLGPGLVN